MPTLTKQQQQESLNWLEKVQMVFFGNPKDKVPREFANTILKVADYPRPFVLEFKEQEIHKDTMLHVIHLGKAKLKGAEIVSENFNVLPFKRKTH